MLGRLPCREPWPERRLYSFFVSFSTSIGLVHFCFPNGKPVSNKGEFWICPAKKKHVRADNRNIYLSKDLSTESSTGQDDVDKKCTKTWFFKVMWIRAFALRVRTLQSLPYQFSKLDLVRVFGQFRALRDFFFWVRPSWKAGQLNWTVDRTLYGLWLILRSIWEEFQTFLWFLRSVNLIFYFLFRLMSKFPTEAKKCLSTCTPLTKFS